MTTPQNSQLSTLNSQLLKTAIFGGTFNPVHIGHLALANYLCEFCGLDELWFMVSPQNPMKGESDFLSDAQRLELVQAAIQEYPKFRASDFEFSLPRPSYTIHTLDKLKESYPDREFFLIIGGDNWNSIQRWKEAERLIAENNILVYPRPGYIINKRDFPVTVKQVEAPLLDISSTFIRNAMKGGKDVRYFLHPEVYRKLSAIISPD